MSASCSATLPDYRSLLTVSDNCTIAGSLVTTQSPAAGTVISGSGNMTVNFTVADAAGNSSNCSITLTKRDVTAPVITGPANKQVNTDANLCGAVVKYAPDNAIVFSQDFVQGGTNSTYCNAWTTFTNQLVAGNTYSKLTIKGTYDQTGVSVTDPAIIAQIAVALKNGTNGTWSTNGRTWAVGNCGGPGALSATNGYVCSCDQNGYVVRPCIDLQSGYPNPNWGGVNTVTCNSPSQNITVVFEMSGGGNGTGGITATDACNGPVTITQTAGLASGSLFPVGSTTNTFTATDASGNISTYSFDVTVTDNERPTITAPLAITVNNAPGTCGATVGLGTPVTADNCGVATVTNNAPAIFPIGTTTVTWTVTDVNGNSQTATRTVTVIDNQPPVIVCAANIEVYATSAAGAVVTYSNPVGTDNCTGVTTARTGGPASGSVFPIGTTTITYTATDAAGLTATCSFTVTVTGLPPVIVCPVDIAVTSTAGQCGTVVNFAATETTAIPASTTVYTENGNVVTSGSFFTVGTHTITATATNPVGSVSCAFTITVTDVETPVIITPADIAVNNDAGVCGAQISITPPAATDNCGIASVIGVRTDGYLLTDVYPVGVTAIMWIATDMNGLTSGHTQLVNVTDNEAPKVITNNITIQLDANGAASITTSQINNGSTDNCGIATVS
ncbi:MAG: HYR domain-containing protein, partial [Sulfuricurvum sp.]|nr:HYR domain-containing protein [Sulfuricurvum sp.]